MKALFAPILIALLAALAVGCGGSSKSAASSSTADNLASTRTASDTSTAHPTTEPDGDDADDTYKDNSSGENEDDAEVLDYGHPAGPAEAQSASAFARRYLEASAKADGAAACAMLSPRIEKGTPGHRVRPPNPSYLSGNTCAEVLTKLFTHEHKRLAFEIANLKIIAVRSSPIDTFILFGFNGSKERRYMGIRRESGIWRMTDLTDTEFP